jgi:glyoxylase-like metal-dependent hydrolase (beta-lactamase superfamily II)
MERRKFISHTGKLTALTLVGTSLLNDKIFASQPTLSDNQLLTLKNNGAITMSPICPNFNTTYFSKGKEIKVHAIQTGQISVKINFLNRKGKGLFSKANILFGHKFADFMPIWVWVIEHPEGIFIIDTGDIEEADHKDFYKQENFDSKFNLLAMTNKRKITKDDEINNQLSKINIQPEQISKVILTHLHGDHTDGLKFFPTNDILVNELEHRHSYGNLPITYPKWFKPTLLNFSKDRVDIFNEGYSIKNVKIYGWFLRKDIHTITALYYSKQIMSTYYLQETLLIISNNS